VALVSGAGDGIGWAIAQVFAGAGYRVGLLDIDGAKVEDRARALDAASGLGHLAFQVDVTDAGAVARAVSALAEAGGGLDVLVNNAGVADTMAATVDQREEDFRRVLDIHLGGAFLLSREAAKVMLVQGGGAIVNLSSIAGFGGIPRRNAYAAAKTGIRGMTRSMACEWAAGGIRVNAVAPGYVETDLVRALVDQGRLDKGALVRRTPMGRLIGPEDIAQAVLFLASDAARAITGVTLPVDGGWTAFMASGDAFDDGEDRA
jgi:NAD(P)-dependent dehydrogenase (short-subunit alcohol dehydrogenase family)